VILLAGGTGTLGRPLVSRLIASGDAVRVLTRDPAHAKELPGEIAIGDVRDARTLAAAVNGCRTVVSAVHGFLGGRNGGPEAVDDRGNANLLQAATEAGVDHFILLSVLDARPDHPMSLHRAKHAAEQHLYASGLAYTVLRPSAYLETWTGIIGGKLAGGGPAMVFGHGRNPINFVSVCDVVTLVEQAIHDPLLRHQTVDVPGPDNLTMTQLAQLLGATSIRHVPRGVLRILATCASPFAPAFARQAAAAVVMDSTSMAADATALHARFPHIAWHHAATLIAARSSGLAPLA
jgi:uncharacterized protein YbjT (DUF2867 family)